MRWTTFTCAVMAAPCLAGIGDKIKDAAGAILPHRSEQSSPSPSSPPSPHSPQPSPPPPRLPPLSPPPIDSCFAQYDWGAHGEFFRGSVARTVSGRDCQLWRRQYPHKHSFEVSLGEETPLVSNYCRNPTDVDIPLRTAPWCYTTDSDVIFELCDVCSASQSLLRPVSAPHVHKPVPPWVGPLCLTFSFAVLVAVCSYIGWKLSGRECGSACEEMAFGRRRARATRGQGRSPRPAAPPPGDGRPHGNITTGEGTFSTLAGLARFQSQGSAKPTSSSRELKATAGLALLEHDMVVQPPENLNSV
uniref:Kringle domain-containing protein n=1 Tax=Calcidiscus leptoporus TaxID=127549 RepID=A0A7S0IZA4_9EUKA|mmetsp:Transcript_30906/g.71827  ORF Transcript_30906/g.71827 Transcript_30906/m.71827 type:complete len:303 (+) Transcript_30906:116-1024(+)